MTKRIAITGGPRTGKSTTGRRLAAETGLPLTSTDDYKDLGWSEASQAVADQLAKGEPGIVEPAVILHDVGWSQLEPEQTRVAFGVRARGEEAERLNRIHEREGAVIARRILQSLDYPPPWIERIALLIERHDSGDRADSLGSK